GRARVGTGLRHGNHQDEMRLASHTSMGQFTAHRFCEPPGHVQAQADVVPLRQWVHALTQARPMVHDLAEITFTELSTPDLDGSGSGRASAMGTIRMKCVSPRTRRWVSSPPIASASRRATYRPRQMSSPFANGSTPSPRPGPWSTTWQR